VLETDVLSDATIRFGEDLTTALLGLDALYAAEQGKGEHGSGGDIERLVVLNMSTTHRPEPFESYAAAIDRFTELAARAVSLPEPDRRLYYRQTCQSSIAFAAWRANGLAFPDQITRFLHVPPRPATDAELDELRHGMRTILTELGYTGDLPAQCAAWEARQRVEPDAVLPVLDELLSNAWDLTADFMEIPAPKSDGMRVETVRATPYNAMCDYSHRLIRLNIDPVLTLPGLRHLAVHEGYPGHYVQFRRREIGYEQGISPADGLLSVVNTASSSAFEGIADIGLSILGWDRTPDDHLSDLITKYRSGVGTRAAWRLHAEGWAPERVRAELLADGLTGGEGWADARMRFISRHDRATLIWSYWWGLPTLEGVWQRVSDDQVSSADYITWIYDRMHSLASVVMLGAS
jgi:hypothetical protein